MITLTSSAVDHIKSLIASRDQNTFGVKIGISTKGCSGLSYTMKFVDKVDQSDEMFTFDDVKIFIDKKASLFLIGTQMDYIKGELESGFKFINPNEKGRCGCGESFHI
jgi:iron-sulfur cluster assembly protein